MQAELGLVCSYFNLALMCHYGEGGPEDKRKAFELYRISAMVSRSNVRAR